MKESKQRNRLFDWNGLKFGVGKSPAISPEQRRLDELEKVRQRLEEIVRHRLPLSYRGGEEGFGRLLRGATSNSLSPSLVVSK